MFQRGTIRDAVATAVAVALLLRACGTNPAPVVGEPAPATTAHATPPGLIVSVGIKPEGIAVDPQSGLVAVSVRSPAAIVVLERTGAILRRIELPSPARHLRFASRAGLLLVPAEQARQLIQVDVLTGGIVAGILVGNQPHDAVEVGDRIFVSNEFSDSISVIAGSGVVGTIPAPKQPGGIAASNGVAAVVGVRSHTIRFLDAGSLATIATLPAGQGPTHVAADADGRFFVADTVGNALLTYASVPTPHLSSRIAVSGTPYGIAVDPADHRLFLTLTAKNQVVEYDITGDTPIESRRFPTPRQPNSVTVDAATGAVFVTGTADGVVQIVSG